MKYTQKITKKKNLCINTGWLERPAWGRVLRKGWRCSPVQCGHRQAGTLSPVAFGIQLEIQAQHRAGSESERGFVPSWSNRCLPTALTNTVGVDLMRRWRKGPDLVYNRPARLIWPCLQCAYSVFPPRGGKILNPILKCQYLHNTTCLTCRFHGRICE